MRNWLKAWMLIVLLLPGCASNNTASIRPITLIGISEKLTNGLLANLEQILATRPMPLLTKTQPILVTSFADLNDLEYSSSFGRTMGELISTKFVEYGYLVIEIKATGKIFVKKNEGEFSLSRTINTLSVQRGAQAVVTGTYSIVNELVYVTAKIIDNDGNIMSSYAISLPRSYLR